MKNVFEKLVLALMVVVLVMSFKSFASNGVGDVSTGKSEVLPGEQVIQTSDTAEVRVHLMDDYGNPVSGHKVKLVPSESEGIVVSATELTDIDGEIVFHVAGGADGVVTYSAYDATVDKVLDSKARVVYFNSADDIFVNDYVFAATGNSSGPVSKFEFEDVPTSIAPGEAVTLTVKAVDELGSPVINYAGTLRFSAIGTNGNYALMPGDYTFTAADQGEHTFSLAMSFQQPGTYNVEVRDIDNFALFGEQTFIVQSGAVAPTASGIILATPIAGISSNPVQLVSGTAPAGAKLKVYDNNLEIASLVADINGSFSFSTAPLSDGPHKIYVATVNEIGTITASSLEVTITIDTASPDIADVVLEPSDTVEPGSIVKVKLYSGEILSKASLQFENNIFDLADSAQGYYEVSISAPIAFGNYPLDFVITDQLGNESRLDGQAVLKVGGLLAKGSDIGDVTGLEASAADHRVTLNWKAPTTFTGLVKNYRVFYGVSPNQLTEAVDTFTNATVWYIPNLKNNTSYYFAVVAVDDKGDVSPHFSNIVSVTPNPAVANVPSPDVLSGAAGGEMIEEMDADVSETGPAVWWLVLLSVVAGYFYNLASKRRDTLLVSSSGQDTDSSISD